jgi:multicomponent Na+:H+ antiporter subunit E
MKTLLSWARLLLLFSTTWVSSHFQVLFLSVYPKILWEPGLVVHRTRGQLSDLQLMWLAHLITATPGSLTVDVGEDKRTLTFHLLECHSGSRQEVLDLAQTYERYLTHAD